MKIPIKKTNRKVPRSCYLIYTSGSNLSFDPAGIAFRLVRDISKGLPDPIQFFDTEIVKQQKGDWEEWYKENGMLSYDEYAELKPEVLKSIKNRNLPKIDPVWLSLSKPSLLTKLKNRFKK